MNDNRCLALMVLHIQLTYIFVFVLQETVSTESTRDLIDNDDDVDLKEHYSNPHE